MDFQPPDPTSPQGSSETNVHPRHRPLPILSFYVVLLVAVPGPIGLAAAERSRQGSQVAARARLGDDATLRLTAGPGEALSPLDSSSVSAVVAELEDESDGQGMPSIGLSPWEERGDASDTVTADLTVCLARGASCADAPRLRLRC